MSVEPLDDRESTAPGTAREPLLMPLPDDRSGGTAQVIRWTSAVLWGVAATCLGAWSFSEGRMWLAQRRAMAQLDAETVPTLRALSPPPGHSGAQPGDREDAAPAAPGEPLATISIPRVGLSSAVLAGVDARELAVGVGHFPGTPLPGEPGNVALAGHRDSVFRPLRDVHPGDRIELRAPQRVLTYVVQWTRVVDPDALWVLRPTGSDDLTLVTCYPFHWVGQAPKRFVVRAVAEPEGDGEMPAPAGDPGAATR